MHHERGSWYNNNINMLLALKWWKSEEKNFFQEIRFVKRKISFFVIYWRTAFFIFNHTHESYFRFSSHAAFPLIFFSCTTAASFRHTFTFKNDANFMLYASFYDWLQMLCMYLCAREVSVNIIKYSPLLNFCLVNFASVVQSIASIRSNETREIVICTYDVQRNSRDIVVIICKCRQFTKVKRKTFGYF